MNAQERELHEEKEVVLHLLSKIANSTSKEELQENIADLQSSAAWLQNVKLQNYITTQWLAIKEMWIKFYWLQHEVLLTTNNGVEAQNTVLKEL